LLEGGKGFLKNEKWQKMGWQAHRVFPLSKVRLADTRSNSFHTYNFECSRQGDVGMVLIDEMYNQRYFTYYSIENRIDERL
jgi:hypothetical protein